MVTSTKNPSSVIATENTLSGRLGAWTNPTNVYTENGTYAQAETRTARTKGYFKLYDSSGYVGDLMNFGTINTSALTWSSDIAFTGTLGLTASKVNNVNFGVGQYYVGSSTTYTTRDLRTYNYGFSIPTDAIILGASSRSKQFVSGSRYMRVDVVELTVSYELGGAQSPSSNAYFGGGPAMFRCPTDLFNILKKPIWTQTSRSRCFI